MNDPQADSAPAAAVSGHLDRALALVELLRARCSWDAAQTPQSLRRYLIEETHEVVRAIDAGDDPHLRDELGDLLLNLAFQIVLAEERDVFDRTDVVDRLEEKMRRRHPHVFGSGPAEDWETLKAREHGGRGGGGILADVAPEPDALRHAQRMQARVARVGFDWPDARGAFEKLREEVQEVGAELDGDDAAALEEEIGDVLFAAVNLARLAGVDAPTALVRANLKFARRFGALERLAREREVDVDGAGLEVLDGLWDAVKGEER